MSRRQPERGRLGRARSQEVAMVVTAQATVDKITVPAVISIRCSSRQHQLPPLCTKWPADRAAGKKLRKFLEPGGQVVGAMAHGSRRRRRRALVAVAGQRLGVNDVEQPFAWCPRTTVTSTTTL
jgi:hypothetical protein